MPKQKTICRRLFVALLLLFIMQVLLLPAVIGATYATKSVKPEHIITYTPVCRIIFLRTLYRFWYRPRVFFWSSSL